MVMRHLQCIASEDTLSLAWVRNLCSHVLMHSMFHMNLILVHIIYKSELSEVKKFHATDSPSEILCFFVNDIHLILFFKTIFFLTSFVFPVGGEERTIEFMKAEGFSNSVEETLLSNTSGRGIVNHPFPMNYMLKPWKLGEEFYQRIKFGIVQYVCLIKFFFLPVC